MNAEKLAKMAAQVRTGGKGSVRRKKKAIHKTTTTDDKRLQNTLKRLGVNNIPAIEEVNLFKDNGTVIHFNNPKGARDARATRCDARSRMLPQIQPQLMLPALLLVSQLVSPSVLSSAPRPCVAVQASIAANTYVVSGHAETKSTLDALNASNATALSQDRFLEGLLWCGSAPLSP